MARFEQAANATDEAARQETRTALQSVVEEVGQQYPGFAMGYSLRDSRLAAHPSIPGFSLPKDLNLERVYREKKPLASTTLQSPFRNELSMRMIYAVYKDRKAIGHVWASVSMANVNKAVYQSWLNIFFILLTAWLALMIILNRVFTGISKTVAELSDKIAKDDNNVDLQKFPQLQSVLTAVATLRNRLQEKERTFRTLAENSPDIITRRDPNGQILYANSALTEIDHLCHSHSVGNTILSSSEFIPYGNALARKVIATGTSVEIEYKSHMISGETRYRKFTMVPERDESGQVISALSISRDITDIKEAGELFLTAFNLSPNAMSVVRQSDHTYIQVNDTYVQLTGLSADTVVGRTTAEVELWLKANKYEEARNLLIQQGYLTNYEIQFTARGKVLTGLLSNRTITINGEPCWLNVLTDITEKKRLDAELARLSALNLVGEMAASIGHEVRNPMTTVRGYLQLFQRKAEFLPYNDRLVTMIEEIDRANAIITEFLSLAKNKTSNMEQGNLNTVVQTLFPLMQADALLMGQQLEISSIPIPDTVFDEDEVRQLILNLFRNAIEAMDLFGIIRVRTYATADTVVLEVSDTGRGIPPEIMEKLGTPFFTTKETGTGLGLAVCYRVAHRHGAAIDIDSSPAGTTFSICFKAVEAG